VTADHKSKGTSLLVPALIMWLVLLAAMMVNGTLRVLVLQPRLGEDLARQVACLSGIGILLALTVPFVGAAGDVRTRALFGVGALWLALTVAFEFVFGRHVSGASWESLLADYDLRRGRLWSLVLVTVLFAPWLVSVVRRRGSAA
jgi:hypothetical protein